MTKLNNDEIKNVAPQDIAQTFKQLLIKCNTDAELIAQATGIKKTYLSQLALGAIAKPRTDKLNKIAQALNIEPDQLLKVFINPKIAAQELNLAEINLQPMLDHREDWGAAPDGIICYNRKTEIKTIKKWINTQGSRLVSLYGLGGIGKTTVAIEVARQIKSEFDYVFWRNLGSISLVEMIVQDALKLLETNPPQSEATISHQITRLLTHLRNHRCLLILDQVETVLATGSSTNSYQNGYERYSELFRQIAESNHQSCLLLVGNEKPRDVAVWESVSTSVCSLQIKGDKTVAKQILKDKQLSESPAWDDLITAYNGHPLALKIVATMILELFEGDVVEFLSQNTLFLGDLEFILHQQYQRLSNQEKEIIHTIARLTKPLSLSELAAQTAPQLRYSEIINNLNNLKRRSLLEIIRIDNATFYSLQSIVRKYINSQS